MVFRNFRLQVVVRVLLLTAALTLLVWCVLRGLYLRSAYIGFAVIVLIVEFVRYVDRINHEVKTFLLSISQHDFTSVFSEKGRGRSFDEMHQSLNNITGLFREISSQKEIQHRYLEMLVEHVRVGIISFTEDENIHLVNDAAKEMLRRKVLGNLKVLETVDPGLLAVLREFKSGETRLLNVSIEKYALNLSIHASEFRLDTTHYKLISLQDIRNELDAREVESWQKLIRVLTHEIMNSIAPISSLSDTLHSLVKNSNALLDDALYQPLEAGLHAIKVRSAGLHGFTEAYRKLTRLPQPKFQSIDIMVVVNRVAALLNPDFDKRGISLVVSGTSQIVSIDPDLLEPALINVVQNAADAVCNTENPRISVSVTRNGSITEIGVADNGVGIPNNVIDKIFIPFFTTKTGGSGIGLALSKQIVQLHRGYLRVASTPGTGTVLSIAVPNRQE